VQPSQRRECPPLGAYRKFVEATTRDSGELRAVPALMLPRNRQAPSASPLGLPDSPASAVCPGARARQPRSFRDWARKSQNGLGWWYGFKRHGQGEAAGRLRGCELTTATVDDRTVLAPLTRWRPDGIGGGAGGSLSRATAQELAPRGV
jgi:Transposase DDE domain